MQSKLDKITTLKSKIIKMQNYLNQLEHINELKQGTFELSNIQYNSMTNNVKKRSVSPNCISPISRGIFGKDILNNVIQTNQNNNNVLEMINCYNSRQKRNTSLLRRNYERSISPKLKLISYKTTQQYYSSLPPSYKENNERYFLSRTSYVGKRYYHSEFGCRREIPRLMKKRTFEQRQTNIILNPDPEKEQGKRIVRPIEVSPDHMLTENPKSNQNLYFFSESPICLYRKGGRHIAKNTSKYISLALSSSVGDISDSQNTRKSSKKHFSKYFQENFCSNWA